MKTVFDPPKAPWNLSGVWICALATVACLLPFITKAFHCDDPLFLYAARRITVSPFDPFGFSINWYGTEMPMANVTQNGPFAGYYLALAAGCFGWKEIPLHLALLLPAAAAIAGTYVLAAGLCRRPLVAALATLFCPVFLLSGTTVMCDTLFLSLWIWAVVLWRRGTQRNSAWALIASGVLVAAAATTKYFGVALVPLLLAYSVMLRPQAFSRRAEDSKAAAVVLRRPLACLTVPVVLLLLYDLIMRAKYGHSVLFGAGAYALRFGERGSYLSRGLMSLAFTGGCLATVIFSAPLLCSRRTLLGILAGTAALVGVLHFSGVLEGFPLLVRNPTRPWLEAQYALFVAAGVGLIWLAVTDLRRCRDADSTLLFLWTAGTFLFCWFLNWTVNGRTVLPMAPAAGILIARRVERLSGAAGSRWLPLSLALTGALALAVTWSDLRLADCARTAARQLAERYPGDKSAVLFAGHWGFQYYMESAGFPALDVEKSRIVPGTTVIFPENNTNVPSPPAGGFVSEGVIELESARTLATMHPATGAGFYSSGWGPLPFAFGPVPRERYRIGSALARPGG